MPPSASSKRPFLAACAPVNAPAFVTEELRLDQRFGQRRAADLDERLLAARRVVMDRVRDHFLAGAGLAADQHRRVRARHLRDLLVHLLNGRAVADDVAERVAIAQLAAQVLVLFRQPDAVGLHRPPQFQRLADHRRHDPIELQRSLIVAIGFEGQRDFERAPGAAPDRRSARRQRSARVRAACDRLPPAPGSAPGSRAVRRPLCRCPARGR